jgi:nucleolar protein 14
MYLRRFGESNANLTLEEKMFLRFQQERIKKAKRSKFNLDTAETPILTHKGQILGGATLNDNDWGESDDDENLGKDVVNRLHFGGGLVPTQRESSFSDLQHKSRGDVLQDIVMKSKLYKLEKKEAKDAQEDQREQLDKAYADLVQSASLEFKPTKRDRSEEQGLEDTDEYDKSLRIMAFESRVKPSDRTKTKEEIALAEYEKLAALEQERLKRMQPDDPNANRKRKFVSNDDCIEELEINEVADEPPSESEMSGSESGSEGESQSDSDQDSSSDDGDDEVQESDIEQSELARSSPLLSSTVLSMPHSIQCPQQLDEFKKLVNSYVTDADSFSVLLQRILTWNSVHLPGAKAQNEKHMATFFDILVSYFIVLGDSLPEGDTNHETQVMVGFYLHFVLTLCSLSVSQMRSIASLLIFLMSRKDGF